MRSLKPKHFIQTAEEQCRYESKSEHLRLGQWEFPEYLDINKTMYAAAPNAMTVCVYSVKLLAGHVTHSPSRLMVSLPSENTVK